MKRIPIYIAIITLFGFSQFGLASLAQAKQRAFQFDFAINQTGAADALLRMNDSADGRVEGATEDAVEKTPEPKKQMILDENTAGNDHNELIAQASLRVKEFSTQLKAELVAAIQSGGLDAGVEVCHSKAPQIAERLSSERWSVARTSLKTRNQGNAPDQWEHETLKQFDARFKQGEVSANLVATLSDKKHFRFMKAIPMDQVCLACHGNSIDPSLLKTIQKYYPNDGATGFSLEDIRGAFTLQKDLSE